MEAVMNRLPFGKTAARLCAKVMFWFLAARAIETSENILTARKMMIMILGDF